MVCVVDSSLCPLPDTKLHQVSTRIRPGAHDQSDPLPGPAGERASEEGGISSPHEIRRLHIQVAVSYMCTSPSLISIETYARLADIRVTPLIRILCLDQTGGTSSKARARDGARGSG